MAYIRFYQDGGEMGGGNPLEQIVSLAMQAVQNNDGQMALQACQMLLQFIQQQQGGGSAPSAGQGGEYEEQGAPEAAGGNEEGEPVYRRGGRLIGKIRRYGW